MLLGGAAAAALAGLFYGLEMCKVIRCDSFRELPGTPRDELDGEECDVQRGKSFHTSYEVPKSFTSLNIFEEKQCQGSLVSNA